MSAPECELPLAGVRVVSVEQAIAAPLASRHLADAGAEVVKVERPGGGDFARRYDTAVAGQSSMFVWTNRTKRSVVLDLRDPAGRQVLERLLERADVFLVNLSPAAARRLGLDADAVVARWPSIVACEIGGYGSGGPLAEAKAYDLLVQAESGLLSVTGTGTETAKVGIPVVDIAAAMYAYSAILRQLYHRTRTGAGAAVHVPMFDAIVEWMSYPLAYARYGPGTPERSGAHHATIAPYGPYAAAGGEVVMLAVQNEGEWRRLCATVLEQPELADDPRFATNTARVAHREDLDRAVAGVLSDLPADQVRRRLDSAGVARARVNDLAAVWDHPHLRPRGRLAEIGLPGGRAEVVRPPAEPPGGAAMGPVPVPGQHTEEVLAAAGLSKAEIGRLAAEGVVELATPSSPGRAAPDLLDRSEGQP